MATALDLLMSTKEDVNLLSEESDICTIDAKTRAIFVPSTIVVGGVQSDKNAERIKFSCPKIVGDNLDLSKFSVRINFENVSSVDFNVSIKDQYICDDVAVDGENVTFSWLIGRNAARYMGTVRFIVCAVKTDSDSNIIVEWNTAIAEVPVLEGIEIDQPQIGQEEKDVINQLLELTKNTSAEAVQNVNSAKEQAIKDIQSVSQPDTTLTIEGGLAEAKATGEAIGSLKEDLYDVSKNLINNKAMVDGYYTTTTTEPTIKENTGLKCILVKIKGNTVYTLSSVSYSSVFYDANKQKISVLDKSNSALTFTSPSNSKYISISAYNEYAKTVMLVEGNTLPVEFENYKYENAMTIAKKALELTESIDYKVYHVGVGQEYTNFTNLIKKLDGDATKKIIYIHPGIYDIFAEYGGSSFAKTIADTDWRKWSAVVPPNTRVIGLGRVVFNFLPSSDECTKNSISVLSPINTSGSCIIENITINCKNCRYGIHDETSGLSEFYFAEKMFKNVRVYRTANDAGLSSPYGHAYASGFDVGVNVSFENCIFESPSLAWSVHDRVVKDIINNGGIFNLKHSIFKGDSYAGLQFLNNNTDPSETIVNIIDCDVNKLRVEKVSKSSAQKNGYNITSRLCKNIPVITDFDDDNDYPYKALNVIS